MKSIWRIAFFIFFGATIGYYVGLLSLIVKPTASAPAMVYTLKPGTGVAKVPGVWEVMPESALAGKRLLLYVKNPSGYTYDRLRSNQLDKCSAFDCSVWFVDAETFGRGQMTGGLFPPPAAQLVTSGVWLQAFTYQVGFRLRANSRLKSIYRESCVIMTDAPFQFERLALAFWGHPEETRRVFDQYAIGGGLAPGSDLFGGGLSAMFGPLMADPAAPSLDDELPAVPIVPVLYTTAYPILPAKRFEPGAVLDISFTPARSVGFERVKLRKRHEGGAGVFIAVNLLGVKVFPAELAK